ncbi:hypothetical protein Rahaq_4956 (plasmid) [Rahnella aceris]|uniref:Uncharacterized protein n=1 Tax=Rahnella sp. (strain Y9602) TaxID=2703885 RepID=A0A0H3FJM3_RAHSY|nr:hypothetical protein [Rahnella aceris]ADW76531.1 hypothetical protein Rahaq_4956 [Rahnella aceris]QQN36647.1 hypothetical protein JHW33_08580 [Rahnella aceris]
MQTKLPATVTATMFIFAKKDLWDDEYKIHVMSGDISGLLDGFILLGSEEITVNVPKVDLVNGALSFLNKQKEGLITTTEIAVREIDTEIHSLINSNAKK